MRLPPSVMTYPFDLPFGCDGSPGLMSYAGIASTVIPSIVFVSPLASATPSANFECDATGTMTGAPGLRICAIAFASRWCTGSSVIRIRSAGFARPRSPRLQGSTWITLPACSICTLEWMIGVIVCAAHSAGIVTIAHAYNSLFTIRTSMSEIAEERANVVDEQRRLLERGEVAAARHDGPPRDVEARLEPAPRRPDDLS